ncbi:MAG: transcription elongation factor GreA [Planctomycetes bacterium]|nr:transcription elongation factor GreA [Planctomycetota bacterium]
MTDIVPMSPEGFEQGRAKLQHMKEVERKALEVRLGEARELGDLSENSEFESARADLWLLDQRVAELEDRLARVQVVDPNSQPKDAVLFGAKVKCVDTKSKDVELFELVGEGEADPMNNKISISAPIAQALIGKKVGEIAEVKAPRGIIRYKIVAIT